MSTVAAPAVAPASLNDRFDAYLALCADAGLDLREQITLANTAIGRITDPEALAGYRYIYGELERLWGAQVLLDGDHVLIKSQKALKEILPALRRATIVALDTETTGLDPLRSRVRLLQIGTSEGTYVIDLFEFEKEKLGPILAWLAAPTPIKILHNAKFDAKMILHHLGVAIGGIFDTMLASQVLSSGVTEHRHNLLEVTKRYLGVELDKSEQVSNWEGPLNTRQLAYAAKDVQVLLPLQQILAAQLAERGVTEAAALEFAAVMPLSRVELHGMPYEQAVWQTMMRGLEARRASLDAEIQPVLAGCRPQMSLLDMVSQTVNLGSEAELKRALADMGFDLETITEAVLAPLASQHALMPKILEVRWIDKVLVSFGEEIWRYLHPTTGRLHPDFYHLHGEAGVFRSNQPNLHAVPPFKPYRDPFRAAEGRAFAVLHWPHVELRIWAYLTGDTALAEALTSHADPLVGLAAGLVGQPPERITPAVAEQARAIAYNLAFGRSPDALSRHLQLGPAAVEERLNLFADRFPQAAQWAAQVQRHVETQGFVPTLSGRKVRVNRVGDLADTVIIAQRISLLGSISDLTKQVLPAIDQALVGTSVALAAALSGEITLEGPAVDLTDVLPSLRTAVDLAATGILPLSAGHVAARNEADWLPCQ